MNNEKNTISPHRVLRAPAVRFPKAFQVAYAIWIFAWIALPSIAQNPPFNTEPNQGTISQLKSQQASAGQYAAVNGLQIYYEVHGKGRSLVLLHGGGSTIESTFGFVLPEFAKTHQVIAIELQAHGHTKDIDRDLSFEQDADDVAALLEYLRIENADFMGFSNGGTTCLQLAIRHPKLVNKLVLASATYKRNGMPPGFFEGFENVTLEMLPEPLHQAYLKANPDPAGLQKMFDRDVARMKAFKDISDSQIKSIQAPTLVLNGDVDVVQTEHALELYRTLPHARLAILPSGHGEYLGVIESADNSSRTPLLVTALIDEFLAE